MDYISLMVLAVQTQLKKKHHQEDHQQQKNPKLTAICFFLYWMTYLTHRVF